MRVISRLAIDGLSVYLMCRPPFSFPAPPPRTSSGKPDLSGVWDHPYVPDMTKTARNQIGHAELPYTPAGLEEWKTYDAADGDYTGSCMPYGMTRSFNAPYPIQVMQTDAYVAFLFELNTWFHIVPIDGRPMPTALEPTWFGTSVGRWEGDTLVVEVAGLNGRSWLDSTGQFYSANTRLVERWKLVDANTIDYEVTFEDPTIYTRPWKINFAKRRAGTAPTGGPRGVTAASSLPPSATKDPYASESWERACYEGNTESMQGMRSLGYKWFTGVTPPQ